MSLRFLLLQARRADDPMARHELDCFVARLGVEPDRVAVHNLIHGPPPMAEARGFDALLVGGSGDFSISKGNLPGLEAWLDLVREVVTCGHPTFASCFGYQSVVQALGGSVIHDPGNTEVGTFEVELTAAGRADPLLGALPATFTAQMGHKDRAAEHPPDLDNLASSQRSPLQALRIPNRPIWATQFHPELDRTTNRERFDAYVESYARHMTEDQHRDARAGFGDSHEASDLLRRFIALVFP